MEEGWRRLLERRSACLDRRLRRFDRLRQLLGDILDKPAPTLPEDGSFSAALSEVLALCLDKEPGLRISAKDFLRHPWLRHPPPSLNSAPTPPGVEEQRSSSSTSSRHDRTIGRSGSDSSPSPLERSRSNLRELEMSSMMDGLSLREALNGKGNNGAELS